MADATTLAYMAGFVDADGHISIHCRSYKQKTYYSPLIGIGGTQPAPLKAAKDLWGGSLFTYRPKNPRHRLQFQWQCVGVKAATAIEDILPFLRLKEDQALIALELWEHVEFGRATSDNPYPWFSDSFDPAAHSAALKDRITALNGWRRKQMTNKAPIPPDLLVRQWPTASGCRIGA